MSATLPARAAALRARLAHLYEMGSSVAEASDLEGLRADFCKAVDRLTEALRHERLLTTHGVPVIPPASLVAARRRAGTILDRFKAAPNAATLKRGKSWSTLLQEMETAGRELNAAASSAWKSYRTKAFAGEAPNALDTKLAKTKSNIQALKGYQQLYSQFRCLFDDLPIDAAAITKARKLGSELETAAQAFDFDVTPAVKVFLEAVQSVGGAPLKLLTPEVIHWLQENESLDAYRIKSKDDA